MGQFLVWLHVEDERLVGYGCGRQRIAIPAASIGSIVQYESVKPANSKSRVPALFVLDHDGRILLRANGRWDINGEIVRICDALGLPRPKYKTRWEYDTRAGRSRQTRQVTIPRRAPGYRRLRTVPRTRVPLVMLIVGLYLAVCGLATAGAVGLILLLPSSIGAVRSLIAFAAALAVLTFVAWLVAIGLSTAASALRWLIASQRAGSPAPANRFFGRRRRRRELRSGLVTAAMLIAIPALAITGPIIGTVSLVHGFSDQALVATLRQHGVQVPGLVVDDPTYDQEVAPQNEQPTVHAQLEFFSLGTKNFNEILDPAIGGRVWPINPKAVVTIIYDPANPNEAAVLEQTHGSPWHGAPTANLISGLILTLALPFAVWAFIAQIFRLRRTKNQDLLPNVKETELALQ